MESKLIVLWVILNFLIFEIVIKNLIIPDQSLFIYLGIIRVPVAKACLDWWQGQET